MAHHFDLFFETKDKYAKMYIHTRMLTITFSKKELQIGNLNSYQ